jgi:hypothetical protein
VARFPEMCKKHAPCTFTPTLFFLYSFILPNKFIMNGGTCLNKKSQISEQDYKSRHASYDLRKLRAKKIVQRKEGPRKYHVTANGIALIKVCCKSVFIYYFRTILVLYPGNSFFAWFSDRKEKKDFEYKISQNLLMLHF